MVLVVGFIVVGLVLAIAAGLVFREAARLSEDPPDAVFDPDDAQAWVVEHLDELVAATLTEADVARILGFQAEFFEQRGVSHTKERPDDSVPALLSPEATVDYIVERCDATGEAYLPEQVEGVVRCQLDYLVFIGAIGRPVEELPDDSGPDRSA